jgi:hypothetical protein
MKTMAYSDYGGYAYRNGVRIEERSDAVFSNDGIKATPGMWPGFLLPEGRNGKSYHALLGDGPVFIGMYKQSHVAVFNGPERLELIDLLGDLPVEKYGEYQGEKYLQIPDAFTNDEAPTEFEIEGHRVEIFWRETDNYFLFARLTQPDGSVWTGFSGYGVGAGLEDAGYGSSTSDVEDLLFELFPREGQAA